MTQARQTKISRQTAVVKHYGIHMREREGVRDPPGRPALGNTDQCRWYRRGGRGYISFPPGERMFRWHSQARRSSLPS